MMKSKLILQSAPTHGSHSWMGRCLGSVRAWAETAGYEYRFLDDGLFAFVSSELRTKLQGRPQMLSDLARLRWVQEALGEGCWQSVIWLDADVALRPDATLPDCGPEGVLLGREYWVQPKSNGNGLEARMNIHNAFFAAQSGNAFLDFYAFAAERVLEKLDGGAPLQLVGPKMLTALHNMIDLPTTDAIAMASPLILRDLAAGGGPAHDLLAAKTPGEIMGYNLCGSLIGGVHDGVDLDDGLVGAAIDAILA